VVTRYQVKFFRDPLLSQMEDDINRFLEQASAEGCELPAKVYVGVPARVLRDVPDREKLENQD
jgi:hypothetical protein